MSAPGSRAHPARPEPLGKLRVAAVIPARDEATTVAENVAASLACRYVSSVVVVDDGSTDGTGAVASQAGATVVRRERHGGGGKAAAMAAGIDALGDSVDAVLFVDADCVGLHGRHLDAICAPVVDHKVGMSLGTFDYGRWNWFVLRAPPTTGQRIVPLWVWDAVHPDRRNGYDIEVMLNEVVCEGRLGTSSRVMTGVTHRTKRDKMGRRRGIRATWRMFWSLNRLWFVVRFRTYPFFLADLEIER